VTVTIEIGKDEGWVNMERKIGEIGGRNIDDQ
jgi:hypothetical protein